MEPSDIFVKALRDASGDLRTSVDLSGGEVDWIEAEETVRSSAFCVMGSSCVSDVDEFERFFAVRGVPGRGETRDWPELLLLNGKMPPTVPGPVDNGSGGPGVVS